MKDDYFCRFLIEFHQADRLGSEDCQLWEVEGANVKGTRNKGKGGSFSYKIN